jgi:hypothetical protein
LLAISLVVFSCLRIAFSMFEILRFVLASVVWALLKDSVAFDKAEAVAVVTARVSSDFILNFRFCAALDWRVLSLL